jgi:hypothetical protein
LYVFGFFLLLLRSFLGVEIARGGNYCVVRLWWCVMR